MKRLVTLLLILSVSYSSNMLIHPAFADEARITDLTFSTRQSDNHTILNITVLHHNYYPGHYVSSVQVSIAGTIYTEVPDPTQPLDQSFTVQHDMGVVSGTPTVIARAICNLHGSFGDSTPIVVPEFSTVTITITLFALTMIFAASRRRIMNGMDS
jgi:hypothetical protein